MGLEERALVRHDPESTRFWFAADVLGNAIVVPLYLSFHRKHKFSERSGSEIVALLLLLCTSATAVFRFSDSPTLWVVLITLLLLGVRLGLTGSAVGLIVVTFLGGYFTVKGYGPLGASLHHVLSTRILSLQVFLAFSMLSLYITEAAMLANRRMHHQVADNEARFRLLAEASRDVIVLADLSDHREYVSPAVTEMLGWQPTEVLGRKHGSISSKSLALRRLLGQEVIVLDPSHHLPAIMSTTTSYNPLVELRVNDRRFSADCDLLARSLLTDNSNDTFWQEAAADLLSSLIMLVIISRRGDPATLQDVRRLLLQSSERGAVILENAVRETGDRTIRARMAWLLSQNEKLRAGVFTMALYETAFLDDPQLAASLSHSAFSFGTIKQQPTTVFILPNSGDGYLVKKWFPLVMNSALRALEEFDGPVQVTTIIDNALPLTGIDGALARAFNYGMAHGQRIWLFFSELADARATSFANGGSRASADSPLYPALPKEGPLP